MKKTRIPTTIYVCRAVRADGTYINQHWYFTSYKACKEYVDNSNEMNEKYKAKGINEFDHFSMERMWRAQPVVIKR